MNPTATMKDGNQFASPVFKKRFARRKTTHRPFTFAINLEADAAAEAAKNQVITKVGDRGVVITSAVQLPNNDKDMSISEIVRQSPVPVLLVHSSPKDKHADDPKEADITNDDDDDDDGELNSSNSSFLRRSGRSREPSANFINRRQYPHGTPQHLKKYHPPDPCYIGLQNRDIDAEVCLVDQPSKQGRKPAGTPPGSSRCGRKPANSPSGSSRRSKKASIQQNSSTHDLSIASSKENQKTTAAPVTASGSSTRSKKASTQQNPRALDTSTTSSKGGSQTTAPRVTSSESIKRRKKTSAKENTSALDASIASSNGRSQTSAPPDSSSGFAKGATKASSKDNSSTLHISAASSRGRSQTSAPHDTSPSSGFIKQKRKASTKDNSSTLDTSTASSRGRSQTSAPHDTSSGFVKQKRKASAKDNSSTLDTSTASSRGRSQTSAPHDTSSGYVKKTRQASSQKNSDTLDTSTASSKEHSQTSEPNDTSTGVIEKARNANVKEISTASNKGKSQSSVPHDTSSEFIRTTRNASAKDISTALDTSTASSQGESQSSAPHDTSSVFIKKTKQASAKDSSIALQASTAGSQTSAPHNTSSGYIKKSRKASAKDSSTTLDTSTATRNKKNQSRALPSTSSTLTGSKEDHEASAAQGKRKQDKAVDKHDTPISQPGRKRKNTDTGTTAKYNDSLHSKNRRKELEKPRSSREGNKSANISSASRRKKTESVPVLAVPSSRSGARKRATVTSDDDNLQALGPSPEKRRRPILSSGIKTTSPQKQSQKKTQLEQAAKITSHSRGMARKDSPVKRGTKDSSAVQKKNTRRKSNTTAGISAQHYLISLSKQQPSSSTKDLSTQRERGAQKPAANKTAVVRASPRRVVAESTSSFEKTANWVSREFHSKPQQSRSFSIVAGDQRFGIEVRREGEAAEDTRVKKARQRQTEDNNESAEDSQERKGGRKMVTELNVIMDMLDEKEKEILDEPVMALECRSTVHKVFTFTKNQLKETVCQLTEIKETTSAVNKLKSQCKVMSDQMKENRIQKCRLVEELQSLKDRGIDTDMMRIDQWMMDFEAFQQTLLSQH